MNYLKSALLGLFTLMTMFATAQQDGKIVDKIVAVVGDNIILLSEVESQVLSAKQQGMQDSPELRCMIIEEMLFSKLLLNKAQFDSVEVTSNQVNTELDRRLNHLIQQIGSPEAMEEFYGKSMEQMRAELYDLLEEQMMAQTVQGTITSDVKVTPAEVRKYFNDIPKDSLPYINSKVEVAHIVARPKVSAAAKKAAMDKLDKVRQDIVVRGRSFATMAALHSKDGSSKDGGDLGWLTRSELVPEFSAAAFSLEPDEVSGVVETEFGFHIIQLIERRGERIHCRHILVKPEVDIEDQELALTRLDSIRDKVVNDTLTFEKAAELYSDDEDTRNSNGIISNPMDGSTKFDMEQIDPQLFFAIDKLGEGDISAPVQFEDREGSGFRIVKLNKRTKPHVANLIDDYDLISQVALNDKKNKAMNEWIRDQIGKTYIRIDDDFKDCDFTYDWLKKEQ